MSELATALIHPAAPPPVAWWPPAPGWWALMLLALLLGLSLPWLLYRLKLRGQRRKAARQALQSISTELTDQQWLSEVNNLLKRLLKKRGELAATRLYGQAWLDYLCQHYPRPQRQALEPLAADLYRKSPQLPPQQRQALERELQRWLRHNHA